MAESGSVPTQPLPGMENDSTSTRVSEGGVTVSDHEFLEYMLEDLMAKKEVLATTTTTTISTNS